MSMESMALDAKVVGAIKDGVTTFTAICCSVGKYENFRKVDRCIQRLRKRGAIKWGGKNWSIAGEIR